MEYTESYLEVAPGLRLFYRDFPADNPNAPVVLCLHGLTRNGEDFFPLIDGFEERGVASNYRFVVPDIRGRGFSDYDSNPGNYTTETYVKDCWQLLDHLEISSCIISGTSMGGIIAMHMHAVSPDRVVGIMLNDIGPVVVREGLIYILSYLGRQMTANSWNAAIEATKQRHAHEYPNISEEQWQAIAKRSYALAANGDWVLRYDANIRLALLEAYEAEEKLDLWEIFVAIDKPILCLRGELSRLLTKELALEMENRNPHCITKQIRHRGHVPLLDEAEVLDSTIQWLESTASNH